MKKVIYAVLSFAPTLAFAQTAPNLSGISSLVGQVGRIINGVIPVIFALAVVYFFWGLIEFIRSAGDPAEAAKGKSIMIYGVIAIFIMVSIYGLVNWLQGTLGVSGNGQVNLPGVTVPNPTI